MLSCQQLQQRWGEGQEEEEEAFQFYDPADKCEPWLECKSFAAGSSSEIPPMCREALVGQVLKTPTWPWGCEARSPLRPSQPCNSLTPVGVSQQLVLCHLSGRSGSGVRTQHSALWRDSGTETGLLNSLLDEKWWC